MPRVTCDCTHAWARRYGCSEFYLFCRQMPLPEMGLSERSPARYHGRARRSRYISTRSLEQGRAIQPEVKYKYKPVLLKIQKHSKKVADTAIIVRRAYARTHAHTHTGACAHTRTHTHTYTYTYTYTHTHARTRSHMHTHANTHIHTHVGFQPAHS